MPNHLTTETSPYLLQHADNPVDWYPWCEEAFQKATEEDKPIFLSVGYSACHWCHVMEHESFRDQETAIIMNRYFVSIKVDREERPDIDAIYMTALQALTGSGGWPMSVFLTPDAKPFFGGTYYPDSARFGMPSFRDVLHQIADLWQTRRQDVVSAGKELTEHIRNASYSTGDSSETESLDLAALERTSKQLCELFDQRNGGWGPAPKFPQPPVMEFMLRRYILTGAQNYLDMVIQTLDAMASGGIFDQIGGGFHRYATDSHWRVPHFEKMLYDNAQLASLYLHVWQLTKDEAYRAVATQILDYVAREMLNTNGGFFSAQDADSLGTEGAFYVWTFSEIAAALKADVQTVPDDIDIFMQAYGVTEHGSFEEKNILYVARSTADLANDFDTSVIDIENKLTQMRATLFAARSKRVAPARDDKVLAAWNGLMLAAFAEASRLLSRDDYLQIAKRSASFLLSQMLDANGRMARSWKDGEVRLNGYLEDYAHCAHGLIELYQTTFDPRWLDAATNLADAIINHFSDPSGGFFDTSDDHESLIVRPKDLSDSVMPSGGAMATNVLIRLHGYTAQARYAKAAQSALLSAQALASRYPSGHAHW
ncbi:MAG: thioredoxin domain-containing protein, partial [Coriobacteriaceae bacterium]|nr:thioredoxin domain-containing protein [Coriobacteriaceae bacterium]